MRALLAAIAVTVIAGCATTSTSDTVKVYDRKYNRYTFVQKQADGDFVGTAAKASEAEKPKPSWYLRGHP